MHIKITYHLMPWEIDYALLTFTQLKKSLYYLTNDVEVTIDSVLNLSSNIIDWDKSELPKEYMMGINYMDIQIYKENVSGKNLHII